MSIEIRTATQSDLDYCRDNPINPAVTEQYKDFNIVGYAKTGLIDGKILGVGGAVVYWNGVAEGWYCLSTEANNHKVALVNCLNEMIKQTIADLKLHRLQTVIRVDFIKAKRFIEAAGFELEGTMRRYTEDGIDAFLYSLII